MKRNFKISSTLSQSLHNAHTAQPHPSTTQLSAAAAAAQLSSTHHSSAQLSSAQLSELSLFLHGRSKGVQFPPPANRLTGVVYTDGKMLPPHDSARKAWPYPANKWRKLVITPVFVNYSS